MTNRYRIRSRIVEGAPHRTFYIQRMHRVRGRELWRTIARTASRNQATAFLSQAMGKRRADDAVARSGEQVTKGPRA